MNDFGLQSLLPLVFVIVLVLLTKRTALSLFAGAALGTFMLHGSRFPQACLDLLYGVMGSQLTIWCLLVGGLFGSITAVFQATGSVQGFTSLISRLCTNKKRSIILTWLMAMLLFIDDWLSILTTGSSMQDSLDRQGVSRELQAFLVTTTAASFVVLVPVSSWGVFMTGQLVSAGI